ncbi:MAG TPA: hypothetical protein VMZ27_13690 [Candidatus Saccharimonadales bacterium]|nr:hypothetical protein [Candidatus Saccharimonadales bacterium]
MKRLLLRESFKVALAEEGLGIDLNDTYQVYAAVWDKFECDTCGRQETYRTPGEKFIKQRWIRQAAEQAKKDGWKVGEWTGGAMDCVAFCSKCAK